MSFKDSTLFLGLFLLSLIAPRLSMASYANSRDATQYLVDLKNQNSQRLKEIDLNLKEELIQQTQVESLLNSNQNKANSEVEIDRLSTLRKEHLLRQTLYDRLIFQIDTHFKGGDLKAFLKQQTRKMAEIEVQNTQSNEQPLWKFLSYLSAAVDQIPENDEDVLEFIEGYIKSSGLLQPIRPSEYLAKRNYTNGTQTMAAKPIPRENLGEVVEKQLSLLKSTEQPAAGQLKLRQDELADPSE